MWGNLAAHYESMFSFKISFEISFKISSKISFKICAVRPAVSAEPAVHFTIPTRFVAQQLTR